jgi:hypothetical protein
MSQRPPDPPPYLGETPRQSVQRKLPYYLLGLAIGCVLVGLLLMLRQMVVPPGAVGPNPSPTRPPP